MTFQPKWRFDEAASLIRSIHGNRRLCNESRPLIVLIEGKEKLIAWCAIFWTVLVNALDRFPKDNAEDKAKVEVAVQVSQRWILARLRNRRFFALAELNAATRPLLDELNTRIMRDYGASRADLFATLDRPNLLPLPADPCIFARWKRARVAPDYHVEADGCWYSVPFGLIRQKVDLRLTRITVEVFHRGKRVA